MKSGKNVGRQRVWAFAVEDYAELYGMSVEATRKAIQRGKFDPLDLHSVVMFYLERTRADEPRVEEIEPELLQLPEPLKLLSKGG